MRAEPMREPAMAEDDRAAALAMAQGLGYLVTGLWPIVDMRSFERVTGPKTDLWLVKTVAVLITVIAGTLIFAGRRPRVFPEIRFLAAGAAAGLAGIDLFYVNRGKISRVYLLDAIAELALVGAWAVLSRRGEWRQGRLGARKRGDEP